MINKINSSKILVPIGYDLYLNYDNILGVFDVDTIENSNVFQSKKIIKVKEDIPYIKSYIYCKDDFLIATSIDLKNLKDKINNITLDYYKNKLF